MHSHYMKEVSSKYLLHQRSSHPCNMKFNVLVNEGLRVCRNISIYLGWDEYQLHLQDFVKRMCFSGYDHQMRVKVLKKILEKWDVKLKKYEGTKKMYRSRNEQYDERREAKNKKKTSWYDREKYEGVIFVDVSENSEVMKEVRRAVKKNKLKIKVVEKMQSTLKTELQRSDPFKNQGCRRNNCVICTLELGRNVNCRTRGCVYQIECTDCNRKYRGQTGRSISERFNEHYKDLLNKTEKSVLYQHTNKYHNGGDFNMEVTIISKCFGDPTTRMITEAVMIDELSDAETLNSKT